MCFEESTCEVPQFRAQLAMWPSEVIQARIAFDAACRMDLTMMIEKHLKIDPSGIDISGTGNIVLHSSGHVSIGHTAPVFPLDVHGTEDHTSTNGYYVDNDRAASAGHDEFQSAMRPLWPHWGVLATRVRR